MGEYLQYLQLLTFGHILLLNVDSACSLEF